MSNPPPENAAHIIAAEGVWKSYGRHGNSPGTPVLRGVTLHVPEGGLVALMGSSGSGKTTLLNLVGGLDTPDKGTLAVCGQRIHDLTDAERSAFRLRSIGFVFQFFNLLPNLTVRENVALPLFFLGENERPAHAAAEAVCREVGLGDKTGRLVHQLSGGEMQRVGLARALAHRPRLLLADEPTGNLDSRTGEAILDLIRKTAREHGVSVLMATHDHDAAARADRIIHMQDGQIVEAAGGAS